METPRPEPSPPAPGNERGTYVRISDDPVAMLAEMAEKMPPAIYEALIAEAVRQADLRRPARAGSTTTFARVRHRRTDWEPTSSTRVGYYSRPADARKRMQRLENDGFQVELSTAPIGPWTVETPAPFTAGPEAER